MPTVSVVKINSDGEQILGPEENFEANESQTIFDAAEDNKLNLPCGCLAGSCGSCRVFILEGSENLIAPSVIEENTLKNIAGDYKSKDPSSPFGNQSRIRLSCRAKLNGKGNVKLAPFK